MNLTLPDQIKVTGTERHGHLHFSQDLIIRSDEYYIDLTVDGYQQMIYTNDEIEGVGWEVNEDGEINMNYTTGLKVWRGTEEVSMTEEESTELIDRIVELIYIEL